MVRNLCVFEDERYNHLYPLSLTRPVYELRCGMTSLREKVQQRFPGARLFLHARAYLADLVRESHPEAVVNELPPEHCLFVNGRFLPGDDLPPLNRGEMIWTHRGTPVAAFLSPERISARSMAGEGMVLPMNVAGATTCEIAGDWIEYPWDLVHHNPAMITRDFARLQAGGRILGKIYPNVTLLAEENIHIAAGACIKPGAVLDAEHGPIFIGENTTVMANASLQGPLYVGPGSAIKMGAKIYEGTAIGEVCKVGGEVEECIIHAYSNKQHEGFLGHAYLGEWVNLGADSNNSDLKNNYGTVKVHIDGELVDSGSMFVGLFMGDHSKSGINTMFNTGTVVGVMSNVFGAGYTPKNIPSFAWGGAESMELYQIDKALDTARRVMARRKRELTPVQEKVYRHLFAMSSSR